MKRHFLTIILIILLVVFYLTIRGVFNSGDINGF